MRIPFEMVSQHITVEQILNDYLMVIEQDDGVWVELRREIPPNVMAMLLHLVVNTLNWYYHENERIEEQYREVQATAREVLGLNTVGEYRFANLLGIEID